MNDYTPVSRQHAHSEAREPRLSKLVALAISSARCDHVIVAIRNVSAHGIGIRGDVDILPCERIKLHMPDGSAVGATVRWARKNKFGLSLDSAIDPAMLQPRSSSTGQLIARDSNDNKFEPVRASSAVASRSGFQRSHRDEVLRSSDWNRD